MFFSQINFCNGDVENNYMPWTVSNMDVVMKNVVRLVIDSRNGKENQSWKKKYGRVRKVINIFLWKVRLLILIQLKRKSKNLDYQGTNVIHLISSKDMLNSRNIKKRLCQYYRFVNVNENMPTTVWLMLLYLVNFLVPVSFFASFEDIFSGWFVFVKWGQKIYFFS